MMSLQLGVPLTLAAAILQATILPRLRIFGGQPDLVLLVVLTWALLDHDREAMGWAFIGGLWVDLFSGVPMGISSLVMLPIVYLIGLAEAGVYRSSIVLPLLLGVVGICAYHLFYLLALRFLADMAVSWSEVFFYVTLPSIFFDLVLIFPMMLLLRGWYTRLHPRQVRM
jgi:rod shape-determining protein MreD